MPDRGFEALGHLAEDEDGMRINSAYEQLLARLSGGERDFWDRPAGGWGEHAEREEALSDAEAKQRADANSAYVIGSKALRRDELDSARAWFAVAADAEHPGAAFRSALAAARGAAQEDARDCVNLLRMVAGPREEVRRWLRVAAEWGHGDARHLIGVLCESDGTAPGTGGNAGAGGLQDGAPERPVRVEDTEFYDEMRDFLLVPGRGTWPGTERRTAEVAERSGEVSRLEDAGESFPVLSERAGAPARAVRAAAATPYLSTHGLREGRFESRMVVVLVAFGYEGVSGTSGALRERALNVLERIRGQRALAASPAGARHTARGWAPEWSGLLTEPHQAGTPGGAAGAGALHPADWNASWRLTEVIEALTRVAGCATAAPHRLAGADLALGEVCAAVEQRAAARAPLAWILLGNDAGVVEAAGTGRSTTTAGPVSLRSSVDALDLVADSSLWEDPGQWLSQSAGVTAARLTEAGRGRTTARLWCMDFAARDPSCLLILVGRPEPDTTVSSRRDGPRGSEGGRLPVSPGRTGPARRALTQGPATTDPAQGAGPRRRSGR
ncbi:hypothetical protein [Streptomyces sp. NPDC059783]|uniref:hypothetical protein n=1 Tax=Streptomyces sp. NPDC059783 TaxID=3346944 RepID=UPI003650C4AE